MSHFGPHRPNLPLIMRVQSTEPSILTVREPQRPFNFQTGAGHEHTAFAKDATLVASTMEDLMGHAIIAHQLTGQRVIHVFTWLEVRLSFL